MIDPDEKLTFIVDQVTRDKVTAGALIDGMQAWDRVNYTVRGDIWSPWSYPDGQMCLTKFPTDQEAVDNLNAWVKTVDPLDAEYLPEMAKLLSPSKAPPVTSYGHWVKFGGPKPRLFGPENVAAHFAQAFMLEYGSDLEVAWGNK